MKRTPEEIATELLQAFTLDDVQRAALVTRLALVIDLAKDDGKAFQRPTNAADELDSLGKALTRVRTCIDKLHIDKLHPVAFRMVNRQLVEGDIPLLDEVSAHAGAVRTSAPQGIAEVLHHLAGKLLEHVEAIERVPTPRGASGDFAQFLAAELAYIYEHAAGQPPVKRTDRDTGKTCGPFHDFVVAVLEKTGIRSLGAGHIVNLATRPQPQT